MDKRSLKLEAASKPRGFAVFKNGQRSRLRIARSSEYLFEPERRGVVRGLSAAGFHKVAYVDWGPLTARLKCGSAIVTRIWFGHVPPLMTKDQVDVVARFIEAGSH